MVQRRSVRSAAAAEVKHKVVVGNTESLGILKKRTMTRYSIMAMKEYGAEVVEQRAIPDFRDGLKPVHRCAIWAAYKLGLHNRPGGFRKAARLVGDVIGKYHPHGDASCYSAIVGVTGTKRQGQVKGWYTRNCSTPLFEGLGNWGDFIDGPAAYRYTEVMLSKFSDLFLLDSDYLAVMDYVDNYDGTERIPVILPAKIPVVLLNGYSSIAVGVAASSPPFAFAGVLALTIKALKGEEIKVSHITSTLVPEYPYGGVCVSPRKELFDLIKYGKGSLFFAPSYEVNEKAKTMTFTSVCPGLMSPGSIETFLNKLAALKEVGSVSDDSDKRGPRYVVQGKRGITAEGFNNMLDLCYNIAVRSDSYDIGMTIRQPDGGANFQASTIIEMLTLWATWRIEVELKAIARLISIQEQKLIKLNTIRTAVLNLDVVLAALKIKKDKDTIKINGVETEVDAAAAHLMRKLKFGLSQANMILDMKVRQLRSVEITKLDEQIANETKELKQLQKDSKNPSDRAIRDLEKLAAVDL